MKTTIELIKKLSKVTDYKINSQNFVVFLFKSHEESKEGVKQFDLQ